LPNDGFVYLKAALNGADLQFYYALKENEWIKAGGVLNAGILSDDYVRDGGDRYRPAFTGAFVGVCCQDLSGKNAIKKETAWQKNISQQA
jgi:xylan 1,4-beta-xylosidase